MESDISGHETAVDEIGGHDMIGSKWNQWQ